MEKHACLKAQEIGILISNVKHMEGDLEVLNKAVMIGNGEPPLNASVPMLAKAVETLIIAVQELKTGVAGFLQYQEGQEGYHKGKDTVRRRNRWLIGLLVTVILGLGTTLVVVMT